MRLYQWLVLAVPLIPTAAELGIALFKFRIASHVGQMLAAQVSGGRREASLDTWPAFVIRRLKLPH